MSLLRRLAGQTVIYGISSVLVRILNPLLVPLHTRVFQAHEYGTITEFYAYAAFLSIALTYGLETAFFRYASGSPASKRVFPTAFLSVLASSVIFFAAMWSGSGWTADAMGYPAEYILFFAGILALDAASAIPFARLRQRQEAGRFAAIKTTGILANLLLNGFFLLPALYGDHALFAWYGFVYDPALGVHYVFLSNLLASAFTFLLLAAPVLREKLSFDAALWTGMLRYGLPMLVVGLAGMVNETLDRVLLKYLLPHSMQENLAQMGIYSACYKISIFITIAVQAFRYAAEPFFFEHAGRPGARQDYAKVLKYFTIILAGAFLCIMLFMDVFKHFIGEAYHAGLGVVPVLLMANIFLGIYYNLSVWYKLSDRTVYGAALSVGGALLTIALNVWWIPLWGYYGSAWATFACYGAMMIASWLWGRKHFPVPYPAWRILFYLALATGLYLLGDSAMRQWPLLRLPVQCLFLLLYLATVYVLEKPRKGVS